MRKTNMEGGIIAIKCVSPDGWFGDLPPLGTVNDDGEYTREDISTDCVAEIPGAPGTHHKRSQASKGVYEMLFGKVAFSQTSDEESSESNDITTGRDKVKAYQNMSGSFDFEAVANNNRLKGATKGLWDALQRIYDHKPYFNEYDIVILFNPDKQNLEATYSELMIKMMGVKLERAEMDAGNPTKFRIPVFARKVLEYPSWAEGTPSNLFGTPQAISAGGKLTPTTPIRDHLMTRLKLTFATVTTWGTIKISGMNIYGEFVEEEIDLTTAPHYHLTTLITKTYFSKISTLGIVFGSGWSGGTLQVAEVDVKLIP